MKPILFNTEMVRAILDGRKNVTRRVIKGFDYIGMYRAEPNENHYDDLAEWDLLCGSAFYGGLGDYAITVKAPYKLGDILYVRETWCLDAHSESGYGYKANRLAVSEGPWRPSIHMPKEAARIFLRVTDIRVERLQNITADQCVAEGIPKESLIEVGEEFTIGQFDDLWDSTLKSADLDKYGWKANPWVWVIEFERISKEETQ